MATAMAVRVITTIMLTRLVIMAITDRTIGIMAQAFTAALGSMTSMISITMGSTAISTGMGLGAGNFMEDSAGIKGLPTAPAAELLGTAADMEDSLVVAEGMEAAVDTADRR